MPIIPVRESRVRVHREPHLSLLAEIYPRSLRLVTHGLLCWKPSKYGSRALHHLSREFHSLSVHKTTHRNSARLPRWLFMDAQGTPTDDALQGTYVYPAPAHRIYCPILDIHTKGFVAIQRSERSENTSRYQWHRLRRQPRA